MLFKLIVATLVYAAVVGANWGSRLPYFELDPAESFDTEDRRYETENTTVKPLFYDLDNALDNFLDYVKTYNKVYKHGEATPRFKNFVDNLRLINERNKAGPGSHGINIFADVSSEEFTRTRFGAIPDNFTNYMSVDLPGEDFEAPDSIDWRDNGAVTDVKNQGTCGSCWAFSAVATIEGQYAIKNKKLQQFAEQQILDCDDAGSCQGGYPSQAFEYVEQAGGLEAESDYAYSGEKGQCSFEAASVAVQVTNPQASAMTEEDMAALVASYGPVSAVICATQLQTYTSGIWTPTECPSSPEECVNDQGESQGHAITIVGYGADDSPYWIIKNSWGTDWGDNGYFKMLRGQELCLINTMISTVSVV